MNYWEPRNEYLPRATACRKVFPVQEAASHLWATYFFYVKGCRAPQLTAKEASCALSIKPLKGTGGCTSEAFELWLRKLPSKKAEWPTES